MTVLNKDKILDAAKDFVAQGRLDKAIREYERLLQADPQDMRVKLRLAELFAKHRQVPQAIVAYREVAASYTQEGFYLKAVTVLKGILRLNPSLLDVNFALAELYEKMGLAKDASYQYEILASAYEQGGRYEESLQMRQKLVGLFPEKAAYRIRLAEAYQREDKKEEAIEQFEILAKQYEKEGKGPKYLIDLYEKIIPHRSENKEMFAALVNLYYQGGDFRSALKWLEQKKGLVEDDTHLLTLQAEIYGRLNQLDTARSKYQQLANFFAQKGEVQKALECYENILALLPEEAGTIKGETEKLSPGSFEALLKRASERRLKKEAEEEKKTRELEANKEAARPKPPEAKPKREEPAAQTAAARPPAKPAKPQPRPKKSEPSVETLLKAARSALSLFRAYQQAGLKEEAGQELKHARGSIEKILAGEPNHAEARKLLKELS